MARSLEGILNDIFNGYSPIHPKDEQTVIQELEKKIAEIRPPDGAKVIRIIDWECDFATGTDEMTGTYPVYEKKCPNGGKHEAQTIDGQEVCHKCGGIYQREKTKRRRFDANYKEIIDAEEDRM